MSIDSEQHRNHELLDEERRTRLVEKETKVEGHDSIAAGAEPQVNADAVANSLPKADSDEIIGHIVGGHYRVISELGRGGIGRVYLGEHELLGKKVAIKVLLPRYANDPESLNRFQREAKAATSLHHPNICAVREFGIHDHRLPFLVMDFIDGYSLEELIATTGKLTEIHALEIVLQVCNGLSHAHNRGVIHRDIKLANIMLVDESDGTHSAQLVDFGIAKLISDDDTGPDLTKTGDVFGTPLYMSPEQCMGRKVDSRSDIYSLGCVLYQLVVGRPPFIAESTVEVLLKHVNEAPSSNDLASVSPAMRFILEHALEKAPGMRYKSMEELAADAKAVLSGERPLHASVNNRRTRRRVGLALVSVPIVLIVMILMTTFTSGYQMVEQLAQWESHYNRGVEQFKQGKLNAAESTFESQALAIAESASDSSYVLRTLKQLADVEEELGKRDEAKRHLNMMVSDKVLAKSATSRTQAFMMTLAFLVILLGIALVGAFILLRDLEKGKRRFGL